MDRNIVYPGAIPLDTDILNVERNTMVAIGNLMQGLLGNNTVVSGLACTPTTPASMTVNVGAGSITTPSTVDASSFGSLSADTTDSLVKMGINLSSTPFTLTAPVTSGQSINYLIQATFQETDTTPVTLPYYNSSNPAQPFSGPNNSGTPQNTIRAQKVQLQLKAGSAANAGTQVTPTVDSGWTGLYVITVNFGQVTVTSPNISVYPNAPFLASHLSSHHGGVPGQAPKINLTNAAEVTGVLPYANMSTVRTLITQNTTIYVNNSTGNDAFNGLTPSTAFKTVQAAVNAVYQKFDWNGFCATISVADGTYVTNPGVNGWAVVFNGNPPGHNANIAVLLTGNTASPGNVIFSVTAGNGVLANLGAFVSATGFTVQAGGVATGYGNSMGYGIISSGGSYFTLDKIVVGSCGVSQIRAQVGGILSVPGGHISLTGTTQYSITVDSGCLVWIVASTITVTGLTLTLTFAAAANCGVITADGASFVGTASGGLKYTATHNGVIGTGGAGPNFFPGASAGSTAAGGQYV